MSCVCTQVLVRVTLRCINPTGGHVSHPAAASYWISIVPPSASCWLLLRIVMHDLCTADTYQARGDYGHKPPFVPGE